MDHPAFIHARRSVRRSLAALRDRDGDSVLVLVGLSGGADSLALAAALAAEAARANVRAGAIIVDHGLQRGSADTAARAAAEAERMGLDPVLVRRVSVEVEGGPEAAARDARYVAFAEAAAGAGAAAILTAHTRDDQAEQVLLALARGSGTRSIAGIPAERTLGADVLMLRPFLVADPNITRTTTEAVCAELGLKPWNDPHNADRSFARVRVRRHVIPLLADELGPGVSAGLARSADLAREDAEALDQWADGVLAKLVPGYGAISGEHELAAGQGQPHGELVISSAGVELLAELPAAIRQRVLHRIARERFRASLSREHTLAIAKLITHWRGQGPAFVPGIRVTRTSTSLTFVRQTTSPRVPRPNTQPG